MPTQNLPQGALHARVTFDGTGTVTVLDSLNVSSVTDSGVGAYAVALSITMADTDYAVQVHGDDEGFSDIPTHFEDISTRTTTDVDVLSRGILGAAALDVSFMQVTVLGNAASGTARDFPNQTAIAWGIFFDTGEGISLDDSHNIDSITVNGVGSWTFNYFTNPANGDYACAFLADDGALSTLAASYENSTLSRSGSATPMLVFDLVGFSFFNSERVSFVLYGEGQTPRNLPLECAQVWVKWTGFGGTVIDDSFNVASLTDEAVGQTTVTMTQAFSTSDYVVVASADSDSGASVPVVMETQGSGVAFPRGAGNFAVRVNDFGVGDEDLECSAAAYGRI